MDPLETLAQRIHAEYAHVRRGTEARFAIGHALMEARNLLKSNQDYGRWFKEQDFGFSIRWANTLCSAAHLETRVRELLERSEVSSERGLPIGFAEAVQMARHEQADRVKSRANRPRRIGRKAPHTLWARIVRAWRNRPEPCEL